MVELTSATDAPAPPLNGRRPRVYRLESGALRLARACLALGGGVSVQEFRLLAGGVRIDGRIRPLGALKIVFVRAQEEIRVLGNRVSGEAMVLAYGGSRLDFVATLPGSALIIHFSPAAAQRVTEGAWPALRRRMEGPRGFEALLCCVTQRGRALGEKARRLLEAVDDRQERPRGRLPPFEAEAIIGMSADLIRETVAARPVTAPASAKRRRDIALTVENLLWEPPQPDGWRGLSLDDVALQLRCSRRSVQLALQEEFGLGFVALKRSIRLQQVHAILRRDTGGPALISRVAKAHEFNHLGRFSGHYRDMFGAPPSFDAAGGAA